MITGKQIGSQFPYQLPDSVILYGGGVGKIVEEN